MAVRGMRPRTAAGQLMRCLTTLPRHHVTRLSLALSLISTLPRPNVPLALCWCGGSVACWEFSCRRE